MSTKLMNLDNTAVWQAVNENMWLLGSEVM
jgi:hypothetical protein